MASLQPSAAGYQISQVHEGQHFLAQAPVPSFASQPVQGVTNLQVKMAKYATSLDPRGFIPVYEYLINGQPILWDRETGYVYWTSIWKALGREKNEIAKLVDADPAMANIIKKIRGGFLKIQGTWIPFDNARSLAVKTCWPIREELAVIFGPTFTAEALEPSDPRFLKAPTPNHESKAKLATNLQGIKKVKNPTSKKIKKSLASSSLSLLRNAQIAISPATHLSRHHWHTLPKPQLPTRHSNILPSRQKSFSNFNDLAPYKRPNWISEDKGFRLPPLQYADSRLNEHLRSSQYQGLKDKDLLYKAPQDSSSPLYSTPASNSGAPGPLPCSEDFRMDQKDLEDAIKASLCLQKISLDDGSLTSRQTILKPPSSFSIAGSKFQLIEKSYRPVEY